jgi:5'-nucleotidase
VQHWEGNPVYLGPEVPKDAAIEAALQPWKEIIDEVGSVIVGEIKFQASGSGCYSRSCFMGDLQADAMAYSALSVETEENAWTYATIALTNPGGVRGTLSPGLVTYSNLVTTTPFGNTCDYMEVQGKFIKEALEFSVRNPSSLSVLQTSGLRITFNLTMPSYQRVTSLQVLCRLCDVPRYVDIEHETWYRVVVNNFLLINGDNFAMLRDNMINHRVGPVDADVLENYIRKNSPISLLSPRGRVTIVR